METGSFNSLLEEHLGTCLPRELASQISLPGLSMETRRFIVRMLSLMNRASYPATEFNPFLIRVISTFVPGALPSAMQGRIPPITLPGRHRKLDAYVDRHTWPETGGHPVFVDIGCGFPPVTTAETARNFPDWHFFGVDRSFASYVLYDCDGHYACFDRGGEFQYLQTRMTTSGRALNDNPEATITQFKTKFAELLPCLPTPDSPTSTTVEKDGNRLIHHHIHDFEADNLIFIKGELQDLEVPPARVIRCMNVLLYFEQPVREKMISRMGKLLCEGGIIIAGFNHTLGSSSRYAVYHKAFGRVSLREFAFSPDNLKPLGVAPWYTIHDDDPEAMLLADLTATIRKDEKFWPAFNRRVDTLLDRYGVCRRGDDGFFRFPEVPPAPDELIGKMTEVWRQVEADGYTDGAVDALGRAGYQAWKNSVGDITVKSSVGAFSMD